MVLLVPPVCTNVKVTHPLSICLYCDIIYPYTHFCCFHTFWWLITVVQFCNLNSTSVNYFTWLFSPGSYCSYKITSCPTMSKPPILTFSLGEESSLLLMKNPLFVSLSKCRIGKREGGREEGGKDQGEERKGEGRERVGGGEKQGEESKGEGREGGARVGEGKWKGRMGRREGEMEGYVCTFQKCTMILPSVPLSGLPLHSCTLEA